MSAICCDKCGQPLPDQGRRDPPLPPLQHPAIVTIHDLADPSMADIEVESYPNSLGICSIRRLKPPRQGGP